MCRREQIFTDWNRFMSPVPRVQNRILMRNFVLHLTAFLCLLLATTTSFAMPKDLGGFTPNPEVSISFREANYFIGTQQNAKITITGPASAAGSHTVRVTGPGTDTSVSLRLGGDPGGNTGSVSVNIPSSVGNATYEARVTIGNAEVRDDATVKAADITAKITQSDATPNPADVGEEVTINLDATLEVPSGINASNVTWLYDYGTFQYREDENSPWSSTSPGGSYLELHQSSTSSSRAIYKGSFFSAGEYGIEITVTATFTVNGQQVTRQGKAFAGN